MHSHLPSLVSYLNAEALQRRAGAPLDPAPVITLSREEGAGGTSIARRAAAILTERERGENPWIVLDDLLAEEILRDHRLPNRIRRFLNDEETSAVDDVVEELFGLHPNRHILVQQTVETILHLAKLGRAIFVGRAAHVVLMGMPDARHVRIVGALEQRAERLTTLNHLSFDEARERARKLDKARLRFVRHYFHRDIADPHGYDLVLNTDRLSVEEAARLVASLIPDAAIPARSFQKG